MYLIKTLTWKIRGYLGLIRGMTGMTMTNTVVPVIFFVASAMVYFVGLFLSSRMLVVRLLRLATPIERSKFIALPLVGILWAVVGTFATNTINAMSVHAYIMFFIGVLVVYYITSDQYLDAVMKMLGVVSRMKFMVAIGNSLALTMIALPTVTKQAHIWIYWSYTNASDMLLSPFAAVVLFSVTDVIIYITVYWIIMMITAYHIHSRTAQ